MDDYKALLAQQREEVNAWHAKNVKAVSLRRQDVADILRLTFPSYNGRKFRLEIKSKYQMRNYWSGGTKYEATFVGQIDGAVKVVPPPADTTNPFTGVAHAEFQIPDYVMVVEHVIFCGKDLGVRFYVSPNSLFLPKMLPEATK